MGTSHAIGPTRQTPNALLDTATYCRSHNELDAKCGAVNIWTSHAISRTLRLGSLSDTQRGRYTETVKTEQWEGERERERERERDERDERDEREMKER